MGKVVPLVRNSETLHDIAARLMEHSEENIIFLVSVSRDGGDYMVSENLSLANDRQTATLIQALSESIVEASTNFQPEIANDE